MFKKGLVSELHLQSRVGPWFSFLVYQVAHLVGRGSTRSIMVRDPLPSGPGALPSNV